MKQQIYFLVYVCLCKCMCLPIGKREVQWSPARGEGVGHHQHQEESALGSRGALPYKTANMSPGTDSDLRYARLKPVHHSPSLSPHGDAQRNATDVRKKSNSTQSSHQSHLLLSYSNIRGNLRVKTYGYYGENSEILKVENQEDPDNNTKQREKEGILTFPDQINFAELKSEVKPLGQQSSEMIVVSIATAVAALFSMCVMAALFGCCCHKKRQTDENDNGDPVKGGSDRGDSSTNQKQGSSNRTKDGELSNDSSLQTTGNGDEDDQGVSVKDKIKAFEGQKDLPVPVNQMKESPRQPKKRPETEAFKHFESTGILIGMGKSPKPAVEEDEKDEQDEIELNSLPSQAPIIITEVISAPDSTPDKAEDEEIPEIHNPDVVIATEEDDDDDEFAAIQREASVLKSFKRAAPPRNRSPATRASRQKLQDNLRPERKQSPPKQPSSSDSKSEKTDSVSNSRLSPDKRIVDKPASDQTDGVASPGTHKTIIEINTCKEENRTSKSASGSVENIFYLIDPTVKSKSVGDVHKSSPVDKRKKMQEEGNSRNDQKLVQALKHTLKKDDETSPEQAPDDHTPIKRERTQSDPYRKSQITHQTAL